MSVSPPPVDVAKGGSDSKSGSQFHSGEDCRHESAKSGYMSGDERAACPKLPQGQSPSGQAGARRPNGLRPHAGPLPGGWGGHGAGAVGWPALGRGGGATIGVGRHVARATPSGRCMVRRADQPCGIRAGRSRVFASHGKVGWCPAEATARCHIERVGTVPIVPERRRMVPLTQTSKLLSAVMATLADSISVRPSLTRMVSGRCGVPAGASASADFPRATRSSEASSTRSPRQPADRGATSYTFLSPPYAPAAPGNDPGEPALFLFNPGSPAPLSPASPQSPSPKRRTSASHDG